MNTPKLIALFLAVFAITSHAATYVITGSGTSFTARLTGTSGTIIGTANTTIQTVIDSIKTNAAGADCTIQFGDGSSTLDIGSAGIKFDGSGTPTWGLITLTGKITNTTSSYVTIELTNGVSITSTADIANTADYGVAVRNSSTGTATISGGTVSAARYGSSAITTNSTGKIIVSGSTAKVTSGSNYQWSNGTITINGTATDELLVITDGTVENTAGGRTIRNNSTGAVTINGGTFSQEVYNKSAGTVTINGGTFSQVSNDSTGTVTINSGTFSQVSNNSTGTVTINGGTVSATSNRTAVYNSRGKITVSGTTTKVTSANTNKETISNYGEIEMTGGTVENTAGGITIMNNSTGAVTISGGTVSATTDHAAVYNDSTGKITVSGTTTRVTSATSFFGVIYNNRNGEIEITGGTVENTATGPAVSGGSGAVTISGGTVSATTGTAVSGGSVTISDGTVSATTGTAVSGGSVTISGGTVSATTGTAVNSTGKITVSGTTTKVTSANVTSSAGTIVVASSGTATEERLAITGGTVENTANNASARAVYNASTGAMTISGGTVSATNGNAVNNNSTGAITINGGTVENTAASANARAVYNNSTGAMTISSGTVSANTGVAVYNNSTGKITVSGTATKVSSANVTSTSGTIYNYGGEIEMTGGTVENTATDANARTVYNASTRAATISGGTVSATSSGTAVYNNSTGTVIVNGGTVTGGTKYTNTNNNGTIIAWDNPAGSKIYTEFETNDIIKFPAAATAKWLKKDGIAGIDYTNGAKTGFAEVAGVIVKVAGLENDAPPKFLISATTTESHTYGLHLLAFNKDDHGELSYSLGTFTNEDNILTAKPALSGDGLAITYTGTGKTSGTATLEITVTSQYYTDITATLTFEATPKEEVTISGITAQNFIYDGTPKKGYSGVATSGAYTGALVYEYAGTDYPQTTTPPTSVGEYILRITLPPNAPYTGEWRGTFNITADTPILPQIATGSIRVQATTSAITLENLPKNTKVQIYSLQGKQIYSANSENSQILRIPVQTKGMYVVKAGNQMVRVAVR